MDAVLVRISTALLAILAVVNGRAHFPAQFSSTLAEQNSLSPLSGIGGSSTEAMRDWVKVSHRFARVMRVNQGERIEMECESTGSPTPRIEWFKGGRPVTQGIEDDNEISGFGLAKVVSRFIADCAVPAHEGSYTCSAVAGGVSQITSPTTLIVDGEMPQVLSDRCRSTVKAPRITMFSPLILQTMGSDVKIPCRAQGNPAPRIYWIRDGVPIERSSRIKMLESGDLYINKLRWSDMGGYTCVAENSLGKDTTSTFLYPMREED